MFFKKKGFKIDKDIAKLINSGDAQSAIQMCVDRYHVSTEEATEQIKQYQISQQTDYVYEKPKLKVKKGQGLTVLFSIIICTIFLILFLLIAYLIQLI